MFNPESNPINKGQDRKPTDETELEKTGDRGLTEPTAENEELAKIRKRNEEIVAEATKELDEIWRKAEEKAKENEEELAKIREKNEKIVAEATRELDEIMKRAEEKAGELLKNADEEKAKEMIESAKVMTLEELMSFEIEPYRRIKDRNIQQETRDALREIANEKKQQRIDAMRKKADEDVAIKEEKFKKDMEAMREKAIKEAGASNEKIRKIIERTNESVGRINEIRAKLEAGEIDYKTAKRMLDGLK